MTNTTPSSTPGFFAAIVAWGKKEIATIEGRVATLWDEIEPGIVDEADAILMQFLEAALAAVEQQAPLAISGREKFSNARNAVVMAVEAAGKTGGDTLIDFLVVLALALFKASIGASLI